jgi:hypothetical protein
MQRIILMKIVPVFCRSSKFKSENNRVLPQEKLHLMSIKTLRGNPRKEIPALCMNFNLGQSPE